MLKNKKVIAAALTVVVAAGAFMMTRTSGADAQTNLLNTAKVEDMTIISNVYASGNVNIKESRSLQPTDKGLVTTMNVQVGDKVKSGQVLAEIDSAELQQSLDRKQISLEIEKENLRQTQLQGNSADVAALKKSNMNYENAKKKYDSNKVLFASGSVSESAYLESKSTYEQAQIDLESAQKSVNNSALKSKLKTHNLNIQLIESEIKEIESKIAKLKVVSPIDGTVTIINYKKGETFDSSKALIIVQNFETKEIKALISEGEINKLQLGQPVKITANSIKGQTLSGKVHSIAPGTKKQDGKNQAYTEIIVALDENTNQLKDGFLVNMTIETGKSENAKGVSFAAVSRNLDGKSTVTKLSADGSTMTIPVKIGTEGDVNVELISDKIQVGDELLIESPDELAPSGTEEIGMF